MAVSEYSAGRGWRHSDPATSCLANFGGPAGAASSYTASAGDVIIAVGNIGVSDINHVATPSGFTELWARTGISGANGLVGFAKLAAGGETGVTLTHSEAGTGMTVAALILKGATAPLAIDRTQRNPSDFIQRIVWPTGTTSTTVQPDEGIVAACALSGAATSPHVDGTASLVLAIDNNTLLISFRAVAATGTYNQTFDWTGSNYCQAGIATLKAAVAGGRGKYNPGSGYVKKPAKYNPGSGYVEKPLKHWNGSAWVALG